ncbi:hypothetical protein KNE206_34630 [Kitasatospora sp. NE20-6]
MPDAVPDGAHPGGRGDGPAESGEPGAGEPEPGAPEGPASCDAALLRTPQGRMIGVASEGGPGAARGPQKGRTGQSVQWS